MVFNSLLFVFFYAVVLAATYALRNRVRPRNVMLLVASYVFYGWWDWRFLGLIALSTAIDYHCGINIRNDGNRRRDRAWLLLSIASNLGILGFFKYFDFFAESATLALQSLGLRADPWTLGVILPVGISFYTFQTLSYTIDRYRGAIEAERDVLNFSLFVAFFPQLVAGPIERATNLIPQMRRPSEMTWRRFYAGIYLVGWGLFKKVVIADNVAKVADEVFSRPNPGGWAVLLGVYAFAIQIYCDFSGYTDVARGVARTLGFDLMLNFNLPYFAVNPAEFWRRWHISLSTWLRDYLYVPLGGNRHGTWTTYRNLMLTMTLGGLWHGAAWTFVAWGVFHGGWLCAHRALRPWMERRFTFQSRAARAGWTGVRMLACFHLVCFGWLLFRADSIGQAGRMAAAVGRDAASATLGAELSPYHLAILMSCGLTLLLMQVMQGRSRDPYVLLRAPAWVRGPAYAAMIVAFLLFGEYGGDAFIYFQF